MKFRGETVIIPGKVALAAFADPDGNLLRLAGPPPRPAAAEATRKIAHSYRNAETDSPHVWARNPRETWVRRVGQRQPD